MPPVTAPFKLSGLLLIAVCSVALLYGQSHPPTEPIPDATLPLEQGSRRLMSSVIDANGQYGYFSTDEGAIVKVRLADMEHVDSLWIDHNLDITTDTAARDATGEFAYFGGCCSESHSGLLIKVRLSDFTIVDRLTLDPDEQSIDSILINGDFAYLGVGVLYTLDPDHIVQVRLSDMARVGTLVLGANEGLMVRGAVLDAAGGFAYFTATGAVFGDSGYIIQVRLADLTRTATLTLGPGEYATTAATLDSAGGFAYFGAGKSSEPGRIIQVRLADFTRVATLLLDPGEAYLAAAALDAAHGFAYFGTSTHPTRIIKVRLSDFTRAGDLTFGVGDCYLRIADIDSAAGFGYFGSEDNITGMLVKVRLSDFTVVDDLYLYPENRPVSAVVDYTQGFAYFGTYPSPAGIVKLSLADFSRAQTLRVFDLPGAGFLTSAAALDGAGGYGYFGAFYQGGHWRIVRIRLSDFSVAGTLTLPDRSDAAVLDSANGYAYFGTVSRPGQVVRVRLSDFTIDGTLTLAADENSIQSALLDRTAGFAYFSTRESFQPTRVIQVRLSDFTRTGTLTLDPGESIGQAAVVDEANGYAYFGTLGSPSHIIKVRLSDFTRVDTLDLDPGDDGPTYAVIDSAAERAFFITRNSVIEIRLSDFTRAGSTTLSVTPPSSAAIDAAHGQAYVGIGQIPGLIVRLNYGADVRIIASGVPNRVRPGDLLTYTLEVANVGPNNAADTIVTGTLPAGVTFVTATPPCIHNGGNVRCDLGSLAAGQAMTLQINVQVGNRQPEAPAWLINKAEITSLDRDAHPENNRAAVTTCFAGQCGLFSPVVLYNR
jgi:uncharacterized repeat protein (TIGR01451 family)